MIYRRVATMHEFHYFCYALAAARGGISLSVQSSTRELVRRIEVPSLCWESV